MDPEQTVITKKTLPQRVAAGKKIVVFMQIAQTPFAGIRSIHPADEPFEGKEEPSAASGMHFQMRILTQSVNINISPPSAALLKLFPFFRTSIFSGIPHRPDKGKNVIP